MPEVSNPKPLWDHESIIRATSARFQGPIHPLGRIVSDSRTIQKGDVFVALKGKADGHLYVEQALSRGASAAFISEGFAKGKDSSLPLFVLPNEPNVLDPGFVALDRLARASRVRTKARVIALTGSNGKTTTKTFLHHVLCQFGITYANPLSFNNALGVRLALANLPPNAQFAVFELGMNHSNELTELATILRPEIGILLNIGKAHIGNFVSNVDLVDAKCELFSGLSASSKALISHDILEYPRVVMNLCASQCAHWLSYGRHPNSTVRIVSSVNHGDCHEVTIQIGSQTMTYTLPLLGAHNVMNTVAVIATVFVLGLPYAKAVEVMSQLYPPKGRGNLTRYRIAHGVEFTVIDETYNANPDSFRAALDSFLERAFHQLGRRIAVLGDMYELGSHAEHEHRMLGMYLNSTSIDRVYTVGKLMRTHLFPALNFDKQGLAVDQVEDLIPVLMERIRDHDALMIKGSNSSKTFTLIQAFKPYRIDIER